MANNLRAAMNAALKNIVISVLREKGFTGSFPHFRRLHVARVDLLTFQFDKWGGGFVVEIASGSIDGWTTHWGEHIPANKLTAHDLRYRKRIQACEDPETDVWFRFDDGNVDQPARDLLELLPSAEAWWEEGGQRND